MLKKHTKKSSSTQDIENQLKRALADYANLQKRSEEEKKLTFKFANSVLLVKFLDILDHLEEAQKTINSDGLELVIRKFRDLLNSEGVSEIKTKEVEFDPNLHEGIATVDGEKDNEIVDVLQKGYQIDNKILRPARVKITRASGKGDK